MNHGDSAQYASLQDISLGSLASYSSPARVGGIGQRVPSASSQTTAPSSAQVSTPSPTGPVFRRRSGAGLKEPGATPVAKRLAFSNSISRFDEDLDGMGEDGAGEGINSSTAVEKKLDVLDTPRNTLTKRKSSAALKTSNLTLRDQEKHIDSLKKENFNIKLKVHFLEERLAQLAPDQIDAALRQNINLKIEVQQRGLEMKRLKKLVLELEKELERSRRGKNRERELEEQLEEREREIRELRRRRGGLGLSQSRVDEQDERVEELQGRVAELEEMNEQLVEDVASAKELIEENLEEIERLKDAAQRNGGSVSDDEGHVSHSRARLEDRIEELEAMNEDIRERYEQQAELLAQREDEKEDYADALEGLQLELEDLRRRRDAEVLERSQSRAAVMEEREEREAVEEDLNSLRDRLAASAIEIQQKEDELEMKTREVEEVTREHERMLELADQEWRGQVEDMMKQHEETLENVEDEWRDEAREARNQVEELRDVLAERDAESKELRLLIAELEANTNDLHSKFETTLAHLEREAEDKDAEIENANREIERLGARVYDLEEECDRMKEESSRASEDEAVERERLEVLSAALKEKIVAVKNQLQEVTNMYEQATQDIQAHRARQEELAQHIEDLVAECRKERDLREKKQAELDAAEAQHDASIRRERRTLENKDSSLKSALADLARAQTLLTQREADLSDLQNAVKNLEVESRRAGENHTTDRFSLQLEVDRLKRDVDRLESELGRTRKEVEVAEEKARERSALIDNLSIDKRELTTQLSVLTQTKLNAGEKLDTVQSSLRSTEAELASYKSKAADLESRLSKDQRSLISTENQYRDQLTERNTLLLTIYQYMDKILGVDKTPKKAETKPFTNFGVFHDNLITRLKALSQIQLDFDKRCKEVETRYTDRIGELKKQIDSRWKQIDRFESSVKNLADIKQGWKRKFNIKDGELETLKVANAELTSQLISMKRPVQSENMEMKSLQSRAVNAERRLANMQNQLLATEEKILAMNQKTSTADNKWEARVKEYETRLKAAEERVKRERQGAKERVSELETTVKVLQRQVDTAQKRNEQLNELVLQDGNESSKPGTPHRR